MNENGGKSKQWKKGRKEISVKIYNKISKKRIMIRKKRKNWKTWVKGHKDNEQRGSG